MHYQYANYFINKIIYGEDAKIDLTKDTITSDDIVSDIKRIIFHNAKGERLKTEPNSHTITPTVSWLSTERHLTCPPTHWWRR